MSYLIEELIKKRMGELTVVDFNGLEKEMIKMAIDDFNAYFRLVAIDKLFTPNERRKILNPTERNITVFQPVVNRVLQLMVWETPEYDLPLDHSSENTANLSATQNYWLTHKPKKAIQEINAWMSLWLMKWIQRVKIAFTKEECNHTVSSKSYVIKSANVTVDSIPYMDGLMLALLSRGEFVGVDILARLCFNEAVKELDHAPTNSKEASDLFVNAVKKVKDYASLGKKIITIDVRGGFKR